MRVFIGTYSIIDRSVAYKKPCANAQGFLYVYEVISLYSLQWLYIFWLNYFAELIIYLKSSVKVILNHFNPHAPTRTFNDTHCCFD